MTNRIAGELLGPPLHGFQGDRRELPLPHGPQGLTIALSREAGARGSSIARRVGKRLGWQVYHQELLEFLANNESARQHVLADVPVDAALWADEQMQILQEEGVIHDAGELGVLPRLILTLAARGNAILVGRGAGFLLPRETTLHVRIVAPLPDRVAYMSQWLRLPRTQAAEQVRQRDEGRAEFLLKHFRKQVCEVYDYDLILNSFLLSEDSCAELIATAIQGKEPHDEPH